MKQRNSIKNLNKKGESMVIHNLNLHKGFIKGFIDLFKRESFIKDCNKGSLASQNYMQFIWLSLLMFFTTMFIACSSNSNNGGNSTPQQTPQQASGAIVNYLVDVPDSDACADASIPEDSTAIESVNEGTNKCLIVVLSPAPASDLELTLAAKENEAAYNFINLASTLNYASTDTSIKTKIDFTADRDIVLTQISLTLEAQGYNALSFNLNIVDSVGIINVVSTLTGGNLDLTEAREDITGNLEIEINPPPAGITESGFDFCALLNLSLEDTQGATITDSQFSTDCATASWDTENNQILLPYVLAFDAGVEDSTLVLNLMNISGYAIANNLTINITDDIAGLTSTYLVDLPDSMNCSDAVVPVAGGIVEASPENVNEDSNQCLVIVLEPMPRSDTMLELMAGSNSGTFTYTASNPFLVIPLAFDVDNDVVDNMQDAELSIVGYEMLSFNFNIIDSVGIITFQAATLGILESAASTTFSMLIDPLPTGVDEPGFDFCPLFSNLEFQNPADSMVITNSQLIVDCSTAMWNNTTNPPQIDFSIQTMRDSNSDDFMANLVFPNFTLTVNSQKYAGDSTTITVTDDVDTGIMLSSNSIALSEKMAFADHTDSSQKTVSLTFLPVLITGESVNLELLDETGNVLTSSSSVMYSEYSEPEGTITISTLRDTNEINENLQLRISVTGGETDYGSQILAIAVTDTGLGGIRLEKDMTAIVSDIMAAEDSTDISITLDVDPKNTAGNSLSVSVSFDDRSEVSTASPTLPFNFPTFNTFDLSFMENTDELVDANVTGTVSIANYEDASFTLNIRDVSDKDGDTILNNNDEGPGPDGNEIDCSNSIDCDEDTIPDINEIRACIALADCDGDTIRDDDEIPACITLADCDDDGAPDNKELLGCVLEPDCDDDGHMDGVDIDDDNDGLIEIYSLLMLHNIRYNLAGTSYDDNVNSESTIGAPNEATDNCMTDSNTDGFFLCGYELARNLDFDRDRDATSFHKISGVCRILNGLNLAKESFENCIVDPGDRDTSYFPTDPHPDFTSDSENRLASSEDQGWQPIGDAASPFNAILEGNHYSISNLFTKRNRIDDKAQYMGLFGATSANAEIRKMTLTNAKIIINRNSATARTSDILYLGSLVGHNAGTIHAIDASAGVAVASSEGVNYSIVGGLVGMNTNTGTISRSSVEATSTLLNSGSTTENELLGFVGHSFELGGLVGNNEGKILLSYAIGDVRSRSNFDRDAWVLTEENRTSFCGGLVGSNTGSIRASYAASSLQSFYRINLGAANSTVSSPFEIAEPYPPSVLHQGGLVGSNNQDGTIAKSYALGLLGIQIEQDIRVNPDDSTAAIDTLSNSSLDEGDVVTDASGTNITHNKGGLVGTDNTPSTTTYSYWNTQTTGDTMSTKGGMGKTTTELKEATDASLGIYSTWNTFDNEDICTILGHAWNASTCTLNTNEPSTIWQFGTNTDYPALLYNIDEDGNDNTYSKPIQTGTGTDATFSSQ